MKEVVLKYQEKVKNSDKESSTIDKKDSNHWDVDLKASKEYKKAKSL